MQVTIAPALADVSPDAWNALIGESFPFLEHRFLSALETSGSVGWEAGWEPRHVLVWDEARLVGACPLYLKTNSNGEYIFDWGWADAYQRNGLRYYPKLTSAIPFTPATGPKLLCHPDADRTEVVPLLLETMRQQTQRQASSLHFLFIPPEEIPEYEAAGLMIRHSYQFHWKNRGYADFDAFLKALKQKRGKEIRRERRQVQEQEVVIERLTGDAIQPELSSIFYEFYLSTIDRKWAAPYLTPRFFETVFSTMREHLLLVLASCNGEPVAGAINYRKGDCLYGRYWGCLEDFRSLHFEVCYYQAIEYAIEQGIRLFEAGAQGPHKIQRGFLPELTYSAHWIEHPQFRAAIGRFLQEERQGIEAGFQDVEASLPYRAVPSNGS